MVDVKHKGEQLPDDYPVCWDYFYVIEKLNQYDQLIRSDIKGTVKDLKNDLKKQGIPILNVCKYIL